MALSLRKVKRAPIVVKADPSSDSKCERRDSRALSSVRNEVNSEVLPEKSKITASRPWSELVVEERAPVNLLDIKEESSDKKVTGKSVDLSFFEQRRSINNQYSSPSTLRAWCEVLSAGISS